MRATRIAVAFSFFGATLVAATGGAFAQQQKFDFGKQEYESYCASCHGLKGKGDGGYKPYLTKSPSDLTVLSKKNGGVFPIDRVHWIIDGRQEVGAHGPREMPIWGAHFNAKANAYFAEVPFPYDTEAFVLRRILVLEEYLYRLQVK